MPLSPRALHLLCTCTLLAILAVAHADLRLPALNRSPRVESRRGLSCYNDPAGCVGPVMYWFSSDDCNPSTIQDIDEVFQAPIKGQPGQCQPDPTTEDFLVESWTCTEDTFYPLLTDLLWGVKIAPDCQGPPLQQRTIVTRQCVNMTTSGSVPLSYIYMCRQKAPLPPPAAPVIRSPAPVLSNPPFNVCPNPDPTQCGAPVWISYFSDSKCASPPQVTMPMAPFNTTTGAPFQFDVCYRSGSSVPTDIMFSCDPSAQTFSLLRYGNDCSSSAIPIESDIFSTSQCALATETGLYMKWGCRP